MKLLLVDPDPHFLQEVSIIVNKAFPDIKVVGMMQNRYAAWKRMNDLAPDMVVFNIFDEESESIGRDIKSQNKCEVIYTVKDHKQAAESIYLGGCGYVLKPLSEKELKRAIKHALHRCCTKRQTTIGKHDYERIGIPSIDGIELIAVEHIIRCEGLQRCTRIVTSERRDIISSYPIGVFRNMLDNGTFLQTHKSHLVNYRHIKKYLREGSLIMSDQSTVPVSRRRKNDLLSFFKIPEKNAAQPSNLPMVRSM